MSTNVEEVSDGPKEQIPVKPFDEWAEDVRKFANSVIDAINSIEERLDKLEAKKAAGE